MPTYQYRCADCGESLEAQQSFSDAALTECPACGGSLRKVFGAVGVVFKGSGFYRNDSRSTTSGKGGSTGGSSTSTTSGDASGGSSKDASASKKESSSGSSSAGASSAPASSGSGAPSSSGSSATSSS